MKQIRFLCFLLIPLLLSSCFELIEDISINKDGSGKITLILNASQSKSKLNSILLLEEVDGYRVPTRTELINKVKSFEDTLRNMPGFSEVSTHLDIENFILKIHASFDKVERLNEVIYAVWKSHDALKAQKLNYYTFSNNTYSKQVNAAMKYLQAALNKNDKNSIETATYMSLSRFQSFVSTQINPSALISKNKKIVFLKLPLSTLINKPELFNNKITTLP